MDRCFLNHFVNQAKSMKTARGFLVLFFFKYFWDVWRDYNFAAPMRNKLEGGEGRLRAKNKDRLDPSMSKLKARQFHFSVAQSRQLWYELPAKGISGTELLFETLWQLDTLLVGWLESVTLCKDTLQSPKTPWFYMGHCLTFSVMHDTTSGYVPRMR